MQIFFKKIRVSVLSILALTFLLTPFFVFTADDPTANQAKNYGATDVYNKTPLTNVGISKITDPIDLAKIIVRSVLTFVAVIFFLLFLYAGFVWIKARDNAAEVDKAKNIVESAFYGIIILTLAYAISEFVFSQLIG